MTDTLTFTPEITLESGQKFTPRLTVDYPDGEGVFVFAMVRDTMDEVYNAAIRLAVGQGDTSLIAVQETGTPLDTPTSIDTDEITEIWFDAEIERDDMIAKIHLTFEFPKNHGALAIELLLATVTPENVAQTLLNRLDRSTLAEIQTIHRAKQTV